MQMTVQRSLNLMLANYLDHSVLPVNQYLEDWESLTLRMYSISHKKVIKLEQKMLQIHYIPVLHSNIDQVAAVVHVMILPDCSQQN